MEANVGKQRQAETRPLVVGKEDFRGDLIPHASLKHVKT